LATVNLKVTKPQMEFLESKAINTGFVAGFGSGKSFIGTLKMIRFKIEYPDLTSAMYFPNYGLVRDIAFDKFPDMLEQMGLKYRLNRSAAEISIDGMKGKIIFRSMDNPAMIVGYETAYAIIDEADLLTMEKMTIAYNKILARNRQRLPNGEPNRLDITSTPEGFKFFYKRYVKDFRPATDLLVRASTYSNPYLPKQYIEELESQYPANLIKAYLNGEFVNLNTGNVYPYFDRAKHHKKIKKKVIANIGAVHIGMDFNVGGCVSIVHIIIDGIPICIDEMIAHDTFKTITAIKDKYSSYMIFVYPDASGDSQKTSASTTDIALLRQAGFTVRVDKKNPRIQNRINSFNGLLDHNKWFIDIDRAPKMCEALEQHAYTDKGVPEKMDLHPSIDDFTDACTYFCHKKYGIAKKMVTVATHKI